ncbi:MAG: O-acetylhomoserine aminocarboxypropyltransferase/cysteine synthase [Treponema sp.]|jgi:O-acetylhomoserine (thiol)-lyase|nr:O-acetylhomoserine aminocarboxypropyltransferase/cysteine synthase [Treponema sp.]
MSYEAYNDNTLGFTTKQLHAGYNPAEHYRSKAVPVYQTAVFELGDYDRCVRLFSYEEDGFSYARFSNPTNAVLERRITALEGGAAAVSFSSGMAAISNTLLNLARAGDEILAIKTLYGGATTLLRKILPQYGIRGVFVKDEGELRSYEAAITGKTRAVYLESLGNPTITIVDIKGIADIAHRYGIPLVVDNTFATPYLLRPFEYGADIVCYSATKYLGGHGTTIAGLVVEKGGFDWLTLRFPQFKTFYDDCKTAVSEDELKRSLFTRRLRQVYLTDMGAHLSPMSAFNLLQGMETLSLRMERHVENAVRIAEFLAGHPAVQDVSYPALPGNRCHALCRAYFPKGPGAILALRLKGGKSAALKVLETVRIFDYMVNVGDAKSLIVHPASSTHFSVDEKEREAAGIFDDTLRLSIGIEDCDDLIADLRHALEAVR